MDFANAQQTMKLSLMATLQHKEEIGRKITITWQMITLAGIVNLPTTGWMLSLVKVIIKITI